jgi:hypothetical protein
MDTLEKDTMNTRVGASLPFERQKNRFVSVALEKSQQRTC